MNARFERRVGDIFDLMEGLDQLKTAAAVSDALGSVFANFGIDYFLVSHLPPARERLAPYAILKEWPTGWMTHYDRSGYCREDPVLKYCFETINPFEWSNAPIDPNRYPKADRVMGEASEFGMAEGFCIPIIDVNGFQAVVSMAGERIEASPDERRMLHLLGYYAHNASIRVGKQKLSRGGVLSPREREVLAFIAEGNAINDVAERLGVSVETVTTHLKRAKAKFGTRSTTHTVVEALRQRELRP
ncbi:helix-turn-helix transcriptional regulator [Jiella marina]|uniref:helix-turn-helix transcriptional regulator n=1 Tax=Jiella sp. LLJ827 TaxID=2917712 RepID=UPI0021016E43|nr:LuxR family transcriptional regulator [Jiella sp. LLJ827]MCQ0987737.1 LuxR family transcriptional regulator [Jiella sp. LLJ827]